MRNYKNVNAKKIVKDFKEVLRNVKVLEQLCEFRINFEETKNKLKRMGY